MDPEGEEDDESVDNDENIDSNGYQYDSSYYYHLYTSVFFDECEEVQLNRMDQVNQLLSSIHSYQSSYYCFGTFSGKLVCTLEINTGMLSIYPYDRIVAYAKSFRCGQVGTTALQHLDTLQIMQKVMIGPIVVVVLKTFWIRLVQRTWKRVYRERRRVVQLRCSRQCQRHVELTGRYIEGAHYLPELRGMLFT